MYAYYQPYWTSNCQEDELEHFGIKGMKWGIRRYQNPDGTLTEAGKQRLNRYKNKETKKVEKRYEKETNRDLKLKGKTKEVTDRMRRSALQAHRKNFDAEMKAIKNMSYKDMKNEKSNVGKQWVKSMAVTIGSMAVAGLASAPFSVISWPNYSAIKQNYRVPTASSEWQISSDLYEIQKDYKKEQKEKALKKYGA